MTLEQAARYLQFTGTKSRDAIGDWERGKSIPRLFRRGSFIDYLGIRLGLHSDPQRFHAVWAVLEEEWGWAPISAEEWQQHFGQPLPAPLPVPAFTVEPSVLARATDELRRIASVDGLPAEAPVRAGSRMPIHRNPLFTGRVAELRRLAALFGGEGAMLTTVAISGISGVGKTQLASEFVHRYGQFFAGGVFWLRFADADSIAAEFAACGHMSQLALYPDYDALPHDAQLRLVRAAFESPLPRLLIFDNCEDEKLLAQWRPRTGGCRVLLTGRRAYWIRRSAFACCRWTFCRVLTARRCCALSAPTSNRITRCSMHLPPNSAICRSRFISRAAICSAINVLSRSRRTLLNCERRQQSAIARCGAVVCLLRSMTSTSPVPSR